MFKIFLTFVLMLASNWEIAYPALPGAVSQPRRHLVEIQEFQFHPRQLTVFPGDTIVWINRDIVPHTVTEDRGTWRSQPLEEGQTWEVLVENNEPYTYFCEFHPHMTGTLKSPF